MSELENIRCSECALLFAVETAVQASFVKSNRTFYCPNGHSQHYPKKQETPEIDKLRGEVKSLKESLASTKKTLDIALADIDAKDKRLEELKLELEIYKPASIDIKE
jgi:hypothetical protein